MAHGQRTLVALRASSTRSFFSFSSVSVCAPTCTQQAAHSCMQLLSRVVGAEVSNVMTPWTLLSNAQSHTA